MDESGKWKQLRNLRQLIGIDITRDLEANAKAQSYCETGFDPSRIKMGEAGVPEAANAEVSSNPVTTTNDMQVN